MLERLKEQVVAVAKEADRLGMCRHKSGNFSIYDPETGYVAITPSGVSRDVLATGHILSLIHISQRNGIIFSKKTGGELRFLFQEF